MNSNEAQVSISIVSHNQGVLVEKLLKDIDALNGFLQIKEVIVTCNIKESNVFKTRNVPLRLIVNTSPKGFGANHNTAFKQSSAEYFCVINPDVRLRNNPFPLMIDVAKAQDTGVVVPLVYSSKGQIEDSIRHFPKLSTILKKTFGSHSYKWNIPDTSSCFPIDWGAGIFMLFRREVYEFLGGFDENYFLYYEDADICTRLWKLEKIVMACSSVIITHDAQRASHRQFKYFLWHLASFIRYQTRYIFRYPDINTIFKKK